MKYLSRNAPMAFVVGAAHFLGSHLTDQLLVKGVQVIGIDDLESVDLGSLREASKNKRFNFINQKSLSNLPVDISRIDYAIWLRPTDSNEREYFSDLDIFLKIAKKYKAKLLFISSIDLYDDKGGILRKAERELADFSTVEKVNARVLRLASVYGSGMNFQTDDPLAKLIELAALERLDTGSSFLDIISRAIYVDDAVDLMIKSLLRGGTAQKLYDGALISPIKLSEIKQVLKDPLWHEKNDFIPTKLPDWPTPNLLKTQRELNWQVKTPFLEGLKKTYKFFKENSEYLKQRNQSIDKIQKNDSSDLEIETKAPELVKQPITKKGIVIRVNRGKVIQTSKRYLIVGAGILIITWILIYPLIGLVLTSWQVRNDLLNSRADLLAGNFAQATVSAIRSQEEVKNITSQLSWLNLFTRVSFLAKTVEKINKVEDLFNQLSQGYLHIVQGSADLYQAVLIISGEGSDDLSVVLQSASSEFAQAYRDLGLSQAVLADPTFSDSLPGLTKGWIGELKDKNNYLSQIASRGEILSLSMPLLTGINGKRTYLLALTDNGQIRPGQGVIKAYGEIQFEKGKLIDLQVGSVDDLDKKLAGKVEPPAELKQDLNLTNWSLAQAGFDPDYPTSARLIGWFYNKETGHNPAGVVSLDLTALAKISNASGHINLNYGNTTLNGASLVSSFIDAQDQSNFLSSVFKDFLNQMLFVPTQNWAQLSDTVNSLLEEKHILVYVSDPTLFSLFTSQDWTGVIPRQDFEVKGQRHEFLSLDESNVAKNEVNFFIKRSILLEDKISLAGAITHKLTVDYLNQSLADTKGGGDYKDRLRIFLPAGTNLTAANWGSQDILKSVSSFSDLGRSGYSMLLDLASQEDKKLIFEYTDGQPIDVSGDKTRYSLLVIKQPGTDNDKFDYHLNLPSNLAILTTGSLVGGNLVQTGIFNLSTTLPSDRLLEFDLNKR